MTNFKQHTILNLIVLFVLLALLFPGTVISQEGSKSDLKGTTEPAKTSLVPDRNRADSKTVNSSSNPKITTSTISTISKKPTLDKSVYPTLTDDQVAMSVDELLNDPDLLQPILKRKSVKKTKTETYDDDEEFSAPEEINFNDDFDIPEFAQNLLDDSYPDYYPPTGKLFGFMRRHLLKRGDSPKPWTVTDDFNGDNKPDWAALLVNKDNLLDVIVIYSEDDSYRLEVLFEGAGLDNDSIKIALSQEKPGSKVGASYKNKPGKFRTATLKFPGINIMYYTKSSSLFFWRDYYFDELLTSR